jgi:predicted Zn-dependent peptidase
MRILPRPAALPQASTPALLPGLQAPQVLELASGAPVVILDLPDSPLICIDLWCRAGSLFEQPEESGIAHFLEHMVFKGSTRLDPGEFDWRIEALGGSSNAATGFDDVHYHVLIPPVAAAEAVELLLELVLEPRLEPEAFQLERQVVLEELAQSEDQPEEVALQRLLTNACGEHPYGAPILGRRELLLAHTPESMAAFQQRLYRGDRCVLSLCGPLHSDQPHTQAIQAAIAASPLARLPHSESPDQIPPLEVRPGSERIALPRLESARLLMAWSLPAAHDLTAVMGADLLTSLLAEGRRSRLVDRLREELRLVESIDLDLHVMECGSLALLEAICSPEDLPAVREATETVLRQLASDPIPALEWQRIRRLVANGYRFSLESAGGVAGALASNHLWRHHRQLEAPLQALDGWNPARLQQQCLPLLSPERACVLEVVPA